MTFEEIISILKAVKTIPQEKLVKNLSNAMQFSNLDIKNIFFANLSSIDYLIYNLDKAREIFIELSTKYVSYVMSFCTFKYFNLTINNISFEIIRGFLNNHGSSLGLWMMMDYLFYQKDLFPILEDVPASLSILVENGKEKVFVNGFLLECDTAGSYLPAKLYLNLVDLLDSSATAINSILPVWQESPRWNLVQNYKDNNWLETVAPFLSQGNETFDSFKNAINNAISVKKGPYSYTNREVIDCTPTGAPIIGKVTRQRYEYGKDVLNWLNSSNGPSKYGLRSGKSPDIYESKGSESSGCVRENTSIRMLDGSLKMIEDIEAGDLVLNGYGTFSVCSKEKIYNPLIKEMYSLNNDKVFMSLEHSLMTDRGWCSLKPHLTKALNPNLEVRQLEIGDRVWKLELIEGEKLKINKVLVNKINIESGEEKLL